MNKYEIIVKREEKISHVAVSIFLYVSAALIFIGLYLFAGNVAFYPMPFLFIAAILFSRFFKQKLKVEYEYSFLEGTLTIDKLENQIRRIPVIKLEVSEISGFGRVYPETLNNVSRNVVKVIDLGTRNSEDTQYYFIAKYDDKGQHAFVFTPDEKLLRILSARNRIIADGAR